MNNYRTRPPIPTSPTAKQLRSLLDQYGMYRHSAAKAMLVAEVTVNRYCLPPTSRHALRIPPIRWERLLAQLEALTGAAVEVPQ